MAARYIAAYGAPDPLRVVRQAFLSLSGFAPVLDTANFCLFGNADCAAVLLPDSAGAIIGPVFSGTTAPRRLGTGAPELPVILASLQKRQFQAGTWGSYVALAVTEDAAGCQVMRDPSGAMPCITAALQTSDVTLVFSDVGLLRDTELVMPNVNWSHMAEHLVRYDLRTQHTVLNEVREVLAGQVLVIRNGHHELHNCWSPWDYAAPVAQDLPDAELAQALKETVTGVTGALAGCYRHPLLGVSGGLDSSILAAALSETGRPWTALTMATDEGAGDERSYARILSAALGFPLKEAFHSLADVDVSRPTSGHLPRPILMAFGQSEYLSKLNISRSTGADAFFTGVGGDNVFCLMRSASPLLDHFRTAGFSPAVIQTARNICQLTGCSVGELLNMAARKTLAGSRYSWFRDDQFLNPEVTADIGTASHPWLDLPEKALPGKAAHVAMLVRIQGTIDGFSRAYSPPLVNPLIAQPVMEFCLRVPTWRWIAEGQNRSLARLAFGSLLPPEILNRQSKGTPNSFAFDVIDRNRKTVRELLLGGLLAKHRIVDTQAIGDVLAPDRALRGFDHMRLSALCEAEVWARSW